MSENIYYKCINCGECCNRLLLDRQGVTKGLPLLPDEIDLFRKSEVSLAYAIGNEPKDENFNVFAYQMNKMHCPHRKFGGCVIWAYRPAICRSYPLIPTINQNNEIIKTLDFTCTSLHKSKLNSNIDKIHLNVLSIQEENENYSKIAQLTLKLINNIDKAWFYDLHYKKWIPFNTMLYF